QKGVYLDCISNPDSLKYNIAVLHRIPKKVDIDRFIKSIEEVIKAHKVFGIKIVTPNGEPMMALSDIKIGVQYKKVTSFSEEYAKFLRPFDLENGPLFRCEIINVNGENLLLYDVHHLIFDGTSVQNFLYETVAIYNGEKISKEEMTIFDLSKVEEEPKDDNRKKHFEEFFENNFADLDSSSAPLYDNIESVSVSDIKTKTFNYKIEKFSVEDIKNYVNKNKISESVIFIGAFGLALSKLNGTNESSFITVHNGRFDKRLCNSIGMFVKTLPIRAITNSSLSIKEYLESVHTCYSETKKNDCVSFETLNEKYGVNTEMSFIYQAELFSGNEIEGELIYPELLDIGEGVSLIDFMLLKLKNDFRIDAHYSTELYTESFIESFLRLFQSAVKGLITKDNLFEIDYLDETSKKQLDEFNKTEAKYEDKKTVVDLFREQAVKTPNNISVAFNDRRYTYKEVDDITDALASYLVKNGVGKEKVVGVLIKRSEFMPICSMGVLKAGGAYLPLDPTYPPERLNFMMEDSKAMLLISDSDLDGIITKEFTGLRLTTDKILALPKCDIELPKPSVEDLFVMLYTSGTTGKPKGVMFNHSNTMVTCEWVKKYFDMDVTSRVTAYASYGFDAHAFDIYPALTSGAELHVIADDMRLDFPLLKKYFNDNGITHTVMTTQVGKQFASLEGLKTLKHLSVAGEKLLPLEPPKDFNLYNLYGPTEGSIITSAFKVDKKYKDVPIGKPVDNLKVYVVDKQGKLLPVNAVGELWLSGPHVTRGYLNRPEKMAEAYGNNPFSTEKGYERVYRTGDIVRILSNGNIQFVGRRDAQVKIRGFRVELSEIEEVVRRFDGIKDATITSFEDKNGIKFIAGYVVSDKKIIFSELEEFILKEKPPYMVPAVFMQLDSIPLTQNHKVNKRALPVPERKIENIVPPKTEMQKKIFDIVSSVIGSREFGIENNLFEVGLTSIGTVKLNVMLSETFSISMKIADIKANDTILKLEKFLNSKSKVEEEFEILEGYPITETQEGIFVESMSNIGTTIYNIPVLLKISKEIDLIKLKEAIKCAINAHPYVKTKLFTDEEGNVRAKRNDNEEVKVDIIECKELPSYNELVLPFELLNNSLYRIKIYKTEKANFVFMDLHHIISDGTSEFILFNDIDRAYKGEKLKEEKYSGFELALDEKRTRTTDMISKAEEYFKNLLVDIEDCKPKLDAEGEGAGLVSVTSSEDIKPVFDYCEQNKISKNAFFNSVFSFVLSRFVGKDDINYVTIHNGRDDSRFNNSVTMMVKTIPIVAKLNGEENILDFAKNMQMQLIDSMANNAISFASISSKFGVKSDILFAYQGEQMEITSFCSREVERIELPSNASKMPFSLNLYIRDGKMVFNGEYRKDNYSKEFVSAFIDAYISAISSFIKDNKIKDITMLSNKAQEIYGVLNDSDIKIEDIRAHEFFERWAEEKPLYNAMTVSGKTLTYKELNERANLIAHGLIKLGIKPDNVVGTVLERSHDIVASELGILKSSGAFLNILPSYPDDRIEYCLVDADSPLVITTEEIKKSRKALFSKDKKYKTITIEELYKGEDVSNPNLEISMSSLAYTIYTSGSTGKPKGVMVEHGNLTNAIQTFLPTMKFFKENDNGATLACLSVSFDASIFDVFLPLCSGKHLVMATEEECHNPLLLKELMEKHRIGYMTCTPAFTMSLVNIPEVATAFRSYKSVLVGAEAFPNALYEALRKISPSMDIVNGYGPSECTVCCSFKNLHSGKGITIGRSSGNVKQYVIDAYLHILPPYASGELIISGKGVGRGYINLPEKTAKSFFTFNDMRAYHSGDYVRLNYNGELDFCGRIDNQVKLRGFRIELDEIEKNILSFDGVREAKVIVRNNGSEDYLAGFFTASKEVDIDKLTSHLKASLTYYMVPSVLIQLEKMPLTQNGKIDKKMLPETVNIKKKSNHGKVAKKSLEQRLCEIFQKVLNLNEVFADDNFFELGGTSLSASKVTMLLMSENIEVKYGDIFDNPTPETLAEFIEKRDGKEKQLEETKENKEYFREALKNNIIRYTPEVERKDLGNVLLTGAVGFLGIHVLRELISIEKGHIYCLVRKGSYESPLKRLKTMLMYYFSDTFSDEIEKRITLLDADITDKKLKDVLNDIPFDTVINCAACVKHFSDNDILEKINVGGVENLIEVCKNKNAKLIQISTVSVPGIHTVESYEAQVKMHENELFVIDDMDNKYAISKYHAELKILDAIEKDGLRAKIIRVGNLMGRHSDGEFQINLESNMFISGIRGFATMGKYPKAI
ncbi:MAG: amino acid adenylation domain-containing protein, partial [Firmicutes bacterium]|nr:amino acid adenylation domain-containing protein [Candidatus Caballimonas caccae]